MNNLHVPLDDSTAIVSFNDHGYIYNVAMMRPHKGVSSVPFESLTPQQQTAIDNAIVIELDEKRYEKS